MNANPITPDTDEETRQVERLLDLERFLEMQRDLRILLGVTWATVDLSIKARVLRDAADFLSAFAFGASPSPQADRDA